MFGVNSLKLASNKLINFLIGLFIGVTELGYFEIGSKLYSSLNAIPGKIMSAVTLPLFSQVKSNIIKLRTIYSKLLKFNMIIPLPVYALIIVLCEPIVIVVFGEKWKAVIPIARILCVVGIFQQFQSLNESVLFANSKFGLKLIQEVIKITMISILFYFFRGLGIEGVPWILVVVSLFSLCFDSFLVNKIIEESILSQFKKIQSSFFILILSSILGLILADLPIANDYLKIVLVSISFYMCFIVLLWKFDDDVKVEINKVKATL